MFETSFQAKFLMPMAVTLTFGLLFATGLTLVLVPCLNLIREDILTGFFGIRTTSAEPSDLTPTDVPPLSTVA